MTLFLLAAAADSVATRKPAAMTPAQFAIALGVVALLSAIAAYRAVVALAARGPDDAGKQVAWALLKTFPSTPGRIMLELGLAALYVVGCMFADMIGRPVSDSTQSTLGFFMAAMLGIGAGQFYGKRKTDTDYVAAKNAGTGTTVVTDTATVTGEPVTVAPATPPAATPTEDKKP